MFMGTCSETLNTKEKRRSGSRSGRRTKTDRKLRVNLQNKTFLICIYFEMSQQQNNQPSQQLPTAPQEGPEAEEAQTVAQTSAQQTQSYDLNPEVRYVPTLETTAGRSRKNEKLQVTTQLMSEILTHAKIHTHL